MLGIIPFWPWMVLIIIASILWVLPKAFRINNLVRAQRHGLAEMVERVWLNLTDDEWRALNARLDSVGYMKHLFHIMRGGDWKDLYRPEFFGAKDEDHV